MVTFVNRLDVHGDLSEFLAVKTRAARFVRAQPGCVSHQTLRLVGPANVYVELSVWRDAAAHRAAVTSEGFRNLSRDLAELATPETALYETVTDAAPTAAADATR
ncbi:antibiotic biosynthesis monooxygenase family protein [Streptomyces sp. NBC_01276]|uniref:antibiotic biosynthesis monooxygenase family protein n=1 Tax=Streptomyces sp. NBC_01276 TaxID=2903808 RepID=UPI002F9092B6